MRNRFMDLFGLSAPILQAPIGGAASEVLVTAVARGGGLGSMAMTWTGRDEGLAAAGARAAIAAGADFIIVQGVEAGGHVQSSTPLAKLLGETLALAGSTPVIAAGGISTAQDIARVLKSGAQGVMMGTRFVASDESLAHDAYKQALVSAQSADTVYTNCFDIGWPYAMSRVLRNSTFEMWEAAGNPEARNRPGEGDIVFRKGGQNLVRYCDTSPAAGAEGDLLGACLYAGMSVDGITSLRPAAEIVSSLWAEARALL